MENDRENNPGQSGGQAQQNQQDMGQQGQSSGQRQNQDDSLFQGTDSASDELTSEQQSPGYGDQGAMGQGRDQKIDGQGTDPTGGTSVTGQDDAEVDDTGMSEMEDDDDESATPGSAI